MNEALVVILVLLWAIVLLPQAIRSRRSSPRSTVGGFEHAMDVLAHRRVPNGRELMVPRDATRIVTGHPGRATVLERRRRAFTSLVSATSLGLILGFGFGGSFWLLFVASAAALGAYVSLLRRLKAQRVQASRVVRELAPHRIEDLELVGAASYARAAVGAEGGLQVATRPDEPWQPQTGVRIRRWDV